MTDQKYDILLIDDDYDVLVFYESTLTLNAYSVIKATNGNDGIELAKKHQPQLIILDTRMPDRDGFSVLAELKKAEINSFVILNSRKQAASFDKIKGFNLGADGFLDKVVKSEEFIARIEAFMRHKNTINELKENQKLLNSIIEYSTNVFYIIGEKQILKYISPQVEKLSGFTAEEVMIDRTKLVTDNPINIIGIEKSKIAFDTGEHQGNYEMELKHKTGRKIWVEVRETPVIENGKVVQIVGSITDITEKHKLEEDLKLNVEKYKELFYAESDALFLIDNQSKQILETNIAAAELYGYSEQELLNMKNVDLSAEPDQTAKITIETPIIKDNIINIPLRYHKRKNGSVFPVEITGRFFELNGKMVHIAAIRNISDRLKLTTELEKYKKELENLVEERTKQFEQQNLKLKKSHGAMTFLIEDVNDTRLQLTKAYNNLKAVNNELEAFAYSVSHDLRAPLTRINGFSNAIINAVDEPLDTKIKHYLNRIQVSSQQMASLIDDLLKLSRISKVNIEIEKVDISKIASEIITDLVEDKKYINHKYLVNNNLTCFCDKQLIKVLLLNLISNAFKFSSKVSKPFIEIGAVIINNAESIYVKDNGVGFDMNYKNQLFAPFSRLHTDEEFDGTGIGLATVQRVINRHGGKIWAESDLGKGATFFFTI
ncbi:MAG: PAS domain S-box protein [Salinivirgaceae bacterium]|nr:PAS domain S-box protein [Salinivirgaceae bacterium]